MKPYFEDGQIRLYLGDCREVIPSLVANGLEAHCVIADPPYGETSLPWDRWPEGWLDAAAGVTRSLWCFGSLRLFGTRWGEFADWKLSQDVIWEKHCGTGFARDRFKRVHESVVHWYRGCWGDVYQDVPRLPATFDAKGRTSSARRDDRAAHAGKIAGRLYVDDGLRLARSVQRIPSVRRGLHRTEKPVPLLKLLIAYACPPGGLIVVPFAGSGSDLEAARQLGCGAVGIEADEKFAERAAERLSKPFQPGLFGGAA